MAQGWVCMGGHRGEGRLSLPACPICGVPAMLVDVDLPGQDVPEPTLVGPAPADLVDATLMGSTGPAALMPATALEHMPTLVPPPARSSLPDMPTLVPPPSRAPLSSAGSSDFSGSSGGRSFVVPIPADAGPNDETLVKAGEVPLSRQNGPAEPISGPHGETLVRNPSNPSGASGSSSPGQKLGQTSAQVSGYEILGLLGRGGMGVVYKARQVALNRLVALKMVLAGSHASNEDLARFRIEAQAVAQLQHPNIVQIYEVSERDGKPFFSLEYLDGGSLQGKLDGTPMQPRSAAEMIETLAKAMDYAHKRGIVHRDLKPANILLTTDGIPKITDFGLAKRLEDDQGHTGTEAILGTPTYMAPEQASGKTREVGPGADIYALGAIFYDLLTGRPPFKGTTVLDTLQLVQSAEPVPPARLQPGVPTDVQTICLKCLEKDPAKRYPSAQALADDLRRYLEGRPIEARPASWIERTWKWTRRRPAAAALIVLIVLTPLLLIGLALAHAAHMSALNADLDWANDELTESNSKLADANTQLTRSEASLKTAMVRLKEENARTIKAQQEAVTQAEDAQDSFLRSLQSVDRLLRLVQQRLLNEPNTELVRRGLLEDALKICLQYTRRPGNNPSARLRAARAYRMAGTLEEQLGDRDRAVKSFRSAQKIYDGLIGDGPRAGWKADYASEWVEAGLQLWSVLRINEPVAARELLVRIGKRIDDLPQDMASQPAHQRNKAALLANLGLQDLSLRRFASAAKYFTDALAILRLMKTDEGRVERARVEINRSSLYILGDPNQPGKEAEHLEEARLGAQRAVNILRSLLKANPTDSHAAKELGRAYTNLGLVLARQKDLVKASKVYADAVAQFRDLRKKSPLIVGYKHLLATALTNQAMHYLRGKQPREAASLLAEGRELLNELVAGFKDFDLYRQDLARLSTAQGVALLQNNEPARAQEPFEAALRELQRVARERPDDGPARQEMLQARENLIGCVDRLARQDAQAMKWAGVCKHIRRLVELRRDQANNLKPYRGAPVAVWIQWLLASNTLGNTMQVEARLLDRLKKHQGAAQSAGELLRLTTPDWGEYLDMVAIIARAMRWANEDTSLNPEQRKKAIAGYSTEALGFLKKAAAASVPGMKKRLEGSEFDLLRLDKAFGELLIKVKD